MMGKMKQDNATVQETDEAAQLASNVRGLRARKGLTLEKLADITGVSRATLSRVERGASVPSALVLGKLAAGLEASLSQLLGRQTVRRPVLLPVSEQAVFVDPESGLKRRSISPSFPDRTVDLALNSLPARRRVVFPAHQAGVEEYLHVLLGELWVSVGEGEYRVREGETLFYPAHDQHIFHNRTRAAVAFVIMIDSSPTK